MSFDGTANARAMYEALDAREFERASARVADDVLVLNIATGDVYRGRTGFLEFARGWATALPDVRFQLLKIGSTGDRVVAEYEMEGTHTGPLVTPRGHIPQTGMEVHLRFCDVHEVRDGRVTHIRSYFDSSTFLRQLGLITGSPIHPTDRRAPLELYAQAVDLNAPERHKAIVHRFLQDVYNRQNPSAAADTCAPNYEWHGGPLGETRGLTGYRHVLAAFFSAFPDLEMQVVDTVAERDKVVVRYVMSGTHMGEFQGVAPTFKRVIGGGTSTYRIEDSRIVEEWWQGDVIGLLQQMDAVPAVVRLAT
ncbi:MAG: ester cyclase family protein [Gemmatimonadota bacterium]